MQIATCPIGLRAVNAIGHVRTWGYKNVPEVTPEGSLQNNAGISVRRAEFECGRYLGSDHDCAAYCEQLVLRSWNDEYGVLQARYGRHYRPNCDDSDYYNRTVDCIQRGTGPRDDFCCRSSVSKRCYLENYGHLEPTAPQILHMPKLRLRSNLEQCARILKISEEELADYRAVLFQHPPKARCLLRCLLIREGLYSDRNGPDAHRTYIQCGGYGDTEEIFQRELRDCVASIWARYRDPCERAAHVVFECIPRDMPNSLGTVVDDDPVTTKRPSTTTTTRRPRTPPK
ncbi:hypothetical protein pipiens_013681 [Culex pipiens pipiens]|uniref:Odorant-binding protein n=1 Tax=Culex pipiens pipiens TaxID=38569 RepID=A0ABD1CXH0_CULPP